MSLLGWHYVWRYTRKEDLVRVVDLPCPKAFQNEWVLLEPCGSGTRITLRTGFSWDGCSVVPDAPGTEDASGVHDALLQFRRAISLAWGIPCSAFIAWANNAFRNIMRQDKSPVADLYYWGVVILGPAYRLYKRVVQSLKQFLR